METSDKFPILLQNT